MHKIPTKRAVFVISTGRTGTKFFADLFENFSGIEAVHEPKTSRQLRILSIARQEKKCSDDFLAKTLYQYRKDVSSEFYLESNPFLVGFINAFDEVFENAVVIHIVRDPRSYIKSSINHGNTKGVKRLLNKYLPYFYTDLGRYNDANSIVRAAAFWKITNDFILANSSNVKDFYSFKFEDIFSKGADSPDLVKLASLLGVTKADLKKQLSDYDKVNQSKGKLAQSWSQWSDEDCQQVDKICGKLMKKYGYGTEKEWQEKVTSS